MPSLVKHNVANVFDSVKRTVGEINLTVRVHPTSDAAKRNTLTLSKKKCNWVSLLDGKSCTSMHANQPTDMTTSKSMRIFVNGAKSAHVVDYVVGNRYTILYDDGESADSKDKDGKVLKPPNQ
ncbi:hypothetical protein RJT34_07624 [Clitoria ternatea]|uniref:Uncharacterized protein n=1 Tax=Clitoria ternatea TaxID=43366 RepID=A0AAN9PTM1_CLITE